MVSIDTASVSSSGPDLEVDISDYNHFGKPGSIVYPGSSTDIDYYGGTGRVSHITVPGLMALTYAYSKAGDVLSIDDTVRNFAYTYGYDDLHRLTRETAAGPFRRAESRDIQLFYEGSEVHGVSRVVTGQGERSLVYEDNGNLTTGYDFSRAGEFPERRIAYNPENMPVTLEYQPEGGTVTAAVYTYDGGGRRVKKESGADTVIYVDATYEIRNGLPVKYIFAGNLRIAKVVGSTVEYYHKDHLGSSAIVTDTSGAMTESLIYEAYGQPRVTCAPSSGEMAYTFTDQEWDAESGLYNYDARLYDAVLGRFLSADGVMPNWHNPQALDRYAYVHNNPLKFVDPSGNIPIETVLDIASLGDSIYSIATEPSWANAGYLAWDIAGLFPYVPGSWVGKGAKYGGKMLRKGKHITAGYEAIKKGRPLVDSVKKAFRGQARRFFQKSNGAIGQAIKKYGSDLQIHHDIPLEWAHVMGKDFNPNDVSNLSGMLSDHHKEMTQMWKRFKKGLRGKEPTASQVRAYAEKMNKKFIGEKKLIKD